MGIVYGICGGERIFGQKIEFKFKILTANRLRHKSSLTNCSKESYLPILSAPTSKATVNRLKPICIMVSVFCLSKGLHIGGEAGSTDIKGVLTSLLTVVVSPAISVLSACCVKAEVGVWVIFPCKSTILPAGVAGVVAKGANCGKRINSNRTISFKACSADRRSSSLSLGSKQILKQLNITSQTASFVSTEPSGLRIRFSIPEL
ncbi:hypothetical protein FF38_07367 [Lucilia cuprina]|uniref:Uncharacterized protein n=1 Tax=Lucilia cuprina TaxID=7375 RepID=A0A0L0C9L6_LUCCU|nr:hypothetical protein FF38_07367 [Lucilia cuprina]